MRYLFFGLAACASIAAIALRLMGAPIIASVAVIILAAVFLVGGFYLQAELAAIERFELDDEQHARIVELKNQGRRDLALKQVFLWKRGITNKQAQKLIDETA